MCFYTVSNFIRLPLYKYISLQMKFNRHRATHASCSVVLHVVILARVITASANIQIVHVHISSFKQDFLK